MKQEPISCRADNALAAHCQSIAARWACVLKRPIFYLAAYIDNNQQLMSEVEQNIVSSQWRADQLFAEAEGWGKKLIYETLKNHDILQQPSSMIVSITVLLTCHYHTKVCVCFFFFNYAWAEYYSQQNTSLLAIICRSRGGLSANGKEGKIHFKIIDLFSLMAMLKAISSILFCDPNSISNIARNWKAAIRQANISYPKIRKLFELRSNIPLLKKIVRVIGVLRSPSQASDHPDDLFQSDISYPSFYCRFGENQFLLLWQKTYMMTQDVATSTWHDNLCSSSQHVRNMLLWLSHIFYSSKDGWIIIHWVAQ